MPDALDAKAEAILDAALRLFDEAGFDGARVEDIAAAAGVSKGAVYLHFPSKTAILEALIARHVAPIAGAAAAIAHAGRHDPVGALREILRTLAPRIDDPRVFAVPRLVIASSNRFPEIAARYRQDVFARVHGAVLDLVAQAMAQGQLRRTEPRIIARALMGGAFMEAMRRHALQDPQASVETAAAELVHLLDLFAPEKAPPEIEP